MSHTQPCRRRFQIYNQPELPIRSRQSLCCARLKVCGHNSWPGAIAAYIVCYLFCSGLIYGNKYISFKIQTFHHRSALGSRDKCRTSGGLLEADKTSFVFPAFEVLFVWYGRYGWLAQQIDLCWGRAHVGDHTWAGTDERFWYPACDNSSHRSLLWWQHPIVSTCPILLTSWHSHRGEKSPPDFPQKLRPCFSKVSDSLHNKLIRSVAVHHHQKLQICGIIEWGHSRWKLHLHCNQCRWN